MGSNPTRGSSLEFVSGVVVLYCVALYVVSFDRVHYNVHVHVST